MGSHIEPELGSHGHDFPRFFPCRMWLCSSRKLPLVHSQRNPIADEQHVDRGRGNAIQEDRLVVASRRSVARQRLPLSVLDIGGDDFQFQRLSRYLPPLGINVTVLLLELYIAEVNEAHLVNFL